MTLNETTIWKKNLGISTKNPSKTRLFFLMYIKFTFTFKFHSVPLLNLTVILCRRPSSDTLESINTHRIYCKPDNISASWNQFCWCLVPDLFWLFFPPFTENVSDTILLHNEDLNCRQSESSKAEQTALIIFFKYCYVGMKAFGSHNAFFFLFLFETWIGSEGRRHNEDNSVHLSYRHKSITRANIAFCIHQQKGLTGTAYYRAYPHPTAKARFIYH